MLTKRLVEKATPIDKPQKLVHNRGLYLYVTPHETKSWRYGYRFGGKRFTMTLASFPKSRWMKPEKASGCTSEAGGRHQPVTKEGAGKAQSAGRPQQHLR